MVKNVDLRIDRKICLLPLGWLLRKPKNQSMPITVTSPVIKSEFELESENIWNLLIYLFARA